MLRVRRLLEVAGRVCGAAKRGSGVKGQIDGVPEDIVARVGND